MSDVYFQKEKDVQVSDSDNKNITAVTGEQAKEKRPVKKMVLIGASAASLRLQSEVGSYMSGISGIRGENRDAGESEENCNEDH